MAGFKLAPLGFPRVHTRRVMSNTDTKRSRLSSPKETIAPRKNRSVSYKSTKYPEEPEERCGRDFNYSRPIGLNRGSEAIVLEF